MKQQPNTILVTIKSVYGNDHIYPACPRAHKFADIAGTKTLTNNVINMIKQLGYDVQVQQKKVSL
jgi:hypothetical protein